MLIVPLSKDKIVTKDGVEYRVIEYTNYKDAGPAVYVKASGHKTPTLVYFADIDSINGVRVEYEKSSKIFKALGKFSRHIHLPQPDDTITVGRDEISSSEDIVRSEVKGLKLKSRAAGVNRGLVIKTDAEYNPYVRLADIADIKRAIGSSYFNKKEFTQIYKDYMGV